MSKSASRILKTTLMFSMVGFAAPLLGQVIHSDDFNSDSSGGYRTLLFSPDNDEVTFAFDYSSLGIPEAPNSTSGGTTGVIMRANNPAGGSGFTSAVQIVPRGVGMSIVGKDYRVTADIWMNANGPMPGGGGGSTQAFMAGVGFQAPGMAAIEIGNDSGTYFTITGEGGASTDIRSFTNDGFNADGINQGPSNNSNDAYYADIFPGGIDIGALPVQGGVDGQTGVTVQGQMAFEWHEVRIDKVGTQVDFYVDDLLIASDTDANIDGNVMLGYGDYFSSVSDAPQWSFGIWDNFVVEELTDGGLPGDFDENGVYDCADIDFMVAEIASGNAGTAVDLTGDGLQNLDDVTEWLSIAGEANLGPGKTYLNGDANLDGAVDVGDFNVWNANKFTMTAAWCSGDFSADGSVDVTDFNAWNANKFTSSDAAAVPEPSSLALLVMSGLMLVGLIRRK